MRKIAATMAAPAFPSQQGGLRHEARHKDHISEGHLSVRDIRADLVQEILRLQESVPGSDQTHVAPHALPEAAGYSKKTIFLWQIRGPHFGFHAKRAGDRFQRPKIQVRRISGLGSVPANGLGDPMGKHQSLQEGVAGQTIGPVDTRACDFSACKQARDIGRSLHVGEHAAHGEMSRRGYGQPFANRIDGPLAARAADERKALGEGVSYGSGVQKHAVTLELLFEYRPGHHISWRKLGQAMATGHKSISVPGDQHGSVASHRLGDQTEWIFSGVQSGGMELNELHVRQAGPGSIGHGQPVPCAKIAAGGCLKDASVPSRCQHNRPCDKYAEFAAAGHCHRADATATVKQQVQSLGFFVDSNVWEFADRLNERFGHGLARAVSTGRNDPGPTVSPFHGETKRPIGMRVKRNPQGGQFLNSQRTLVYENLHGVRDAGPVTCANGVQGVQRRRIAGGQRRCDASLCQGGGALPNRSLAQHGHASGGLQIQRAKKPGNAGPDDQTVYVDNLQSAPPWTITCPKCSEDKLSCQ